MTPHPRHRGAPMRPITTRAYIRFLATTITVLVGASIGPAAYADKGSPFGHQTSPNPHSAASPHQQPNQGGKPGGQQGPGPSAEAGHDEAEHDEAGHEEPFVTEPVDVETSTVLRATPQPVTAYEMPFPCGEVWTGSTRHSHSPSVRSVDFNREGDLGAPVVAAAAGVVTTAVTGKNKPSYGQHVIVNHGNDESTMYAHLDSVSVAVGQEVEQGAQLGTVGNTGRSFGAHLHFEQRKGSSVVDSWFHGSRFKMPATQASENCGGVDVPLAPDTALAGNIVGDKAAELMLFRHTTEGTFVIKRPGLPDKELPFGAGADQPFVGDWDGNGRVNPGVRTPSTRVFALRARGKVTTQKFGKKGDQPIAGDWDGTGAWELGVRRENKFVLRFAKGSVKKIVLGDVNDLPITGDWDGDGTTDVGVYDRATATFTLTWTDATGAVFTSVVTFGKPDDLPVTGDWDGDGVTELGVWNEATATFSPRLAQSATSGRAKVSRTRVTGRIAG